MSDRRTTAAFVVLHSTPSERHCRPEMGFININIKLCIQQLFSFHSLVCVQSALVLNSALVFLAARIAPAAITLAITINIL